MEVKEKKSIQYYMRSLHRDIGFFVIGLTLIFAFSGTVLIFRETSFLKSEKQTEKQLEPNINESELGAALRMRAFETMKVEGDVVYFKNGTYNKTTGIAVYTEQKFPSFIEKLNNLHKTSTRNATHWFTAAYGILLFFLAISSLWMFKKSNKHFKRGLVLASGGFLLAIVILFI